MNERTVSTLRTLKQRLEDDDPVQVREALREYENATAETAVDERTHLARTTAAKEGGISLTDRKTLDAYVKRQGQVSMGRAGVLTSVSTYLLSPESADAAELAATVGEHADNARSLSDWSDPAEDVLRETALPASLSFVSAELVGDPLLGRTVTVSAELRNVGDEDATGVEIETDGDGVLRTDAPSRLPAGDTASIDVSVDLAENRRYAVELSAEGDETSADADAVTFEARSKGEALELADAKLRDLAERVRQAGLRKGTERSLSSKTSAASGSVSRARFALGRGRSKKANNQMRTAINQVGALLNRLDGLRKRDSESETERPEESDSAKGSKGSPSAGFVVGAEQQSTSVVNLLSNARDAEAE